MKYRPLYALILVGLAASLSGCFRDWDYDLTRQHDIYRMNYKYKRPAETPVVLPEGTPAAGRIAPPPVAPVQPQTPAAPAAPALPQP